MRGDPKGACDYDAENLKKLIAKGFEELTSGPNIPDALRSPAYEVVSAFQITSLQLGQILKYWLERGTDKYNFDPRDATCRWVAENLDLLRSFIPQSYPRVQKEDHSGKNIFTAAYIVAGIALVMAASSFLLTFLRRHTKVIYHTQVEFLFVFQTGLFLLAVGAAFAAVPPSDGFCVSFIWLTNLAYVLQLVPLAIRIDAINRLASSGKQMQRARLRTNKLFGAVATMACIVAGFLIAWTITDAPEKGTHYQLTGEVTSQNQTVVATYESCGSSSDLWFIVSLSWQAVLLFPAMVVAFVASRVLEDINDTKTMALVICTQAVFLILRGAVFSMKNSNRSGYDSIVIR